jgi:hypothetical protein
VEASAGRCHEVGEPTIVRLRACRLSSAEQARFTWLKKGGHELDRAVGPLADDSLRVELAEAHVDVPRAVRPASPHCAASIEHVERLVGRLERPGDELAVELVFLPQLGERRRVLRVEVGLVGVDRGTRVPVSRDDQQGIHGQLAGASNGSQRSISQNIVGI